MVGTFFAFSTVLCLNLYIALLSETFNRVYANAKANASLLQANTILQIQHALSKKRRKIELDHIQDECGPLVGVVLSSCFAFFFKYAEIKLHKLIVLI